MIPRRYIGDGICDERKKNTAMFHDFGVLHIMLLASLALPAVLDVMGVNPASVLIYLPTS